MSIDSSARLKYFRYQREDRPYITLKEKKPSKFFVQPSSKTRTIQIDSTGQYVEIVEKVANQQTKILLRLPIDDYIKLRLAANERKTWEDLGYAYELKEEDDDLSSLIQDFTDFEIPLPSVGVLSIFGEPKISLRIGGAVDIHGAWRNETTEGVTASRLGNTRNEPDFKQQVQINVNGTIGDKLNIAADWNTERTFEYENQLKIKYTGYEDEIIQSIEAGNVSLQTSPLVGGSEALFGLKANFKMGPFSLTTIATQKKGEIKEVSVSSGTTSQTFSKRAYEYSKNHYFVDQIYASTEPERNYFFRYFGQSTPEKDPTVEILDIEVWKSVHGIVRDRSKERQANAYINLDPLTNPQERYSSQLRADRDPVPGEIETGRFLLLEEGIDYTIHPFTGFITFNTAVQEDDIIAVAYQVQGNPSDPNDDLFFGEFLATTNQADTSAKLVLKLVKPKNLQPSFTQAWNLQLKNIYPVGGRKIKKEGFDFFIQYELAGQDPVTEIGGVKFLNAFGLDEVDESGNPNPNDVFDFRPSITVNTETGEIIFPTLQPFGANFPEELTDTIDTPVTRYPEVYSMTTTFAAQAKIHDKWILTGKYSGEASNVYQLGFNMVENSVRVMLNGRELTPGVDYVVDYNIGQLTIRNDEALIPGADLRITYEQNDLFQLASKTLLGARGVYQFSPKTSLGFSILNLNQQTLSDKVRIGEEPLSNTIMGVDFNTSADLHFLTKLLDNVISTRQMSTFTLGGEFAYIDPDPNTKKSNVVSDNNQSIAYIDDFEGAKRLIPVGVSYTGWKDLSPPDSLPLLSGLSPMERMPFKGKSIWYTITPSPVLTEHIWPERETSRQNNQVTVMDYVFLPDTPGTYNYHPNLSVRPRNWGGIMKVLSSTANNLVEENIEYIEIWAKIKNAPSDARIYIDLGRISEDVIPNRVLDTEDLDDNNVMDVDGNEDTGIEGLRDPEEGNPSINPLLGGVPSNRPDPSGDNFGQVSGDPNDYRSWWNINGTEGNAILTDIGRIPDTEDINRNGNHDIANAYFRYEIPLDTNRLTNEYIAGGGGGNDDWFLYRIPLKEFSYQVNSPSLTNVEYIRLFITGVDTLVHLQLAEFNLVGSQWQKLIPEDTVLSVSVVNIEDNRNYTSPPGIERERDRSQPDEIVLRNEQSLNLILNALPANESREAVKYLYSPLDVFNYKEMKLFIHGDDNPGPGRVSTLVGEPPNAEVFFRFGTDTNNFYEYRQPVQYDPVNNGWNEVSILFNRITSIKQQRDSLNQIVLVPVEGKPGHFYGVRGNPSLTQVKFLSVGIHNISGDASDISGEVWINELRVVGADDSEGWAYSFATSLQLADLLRVSFNMSETNPYFHRLADRFGSRVESKNWGVATELDVLKLLPFSMPESNLKINYSHTESIKKPLYMPGTDIRVADAAQRLSDAGDVNAAEELIIRSQTINISDSWSASNIKLRIPSSFWLIRDTFNALTFGFNYNRSFSRSPTIEFNKSWVWNANMNYALNLGNEYFVAPSDIPVIGSLLALFSDYKDVIIYFVPQTYSLNVTARRLRNTSLTRSINTTTGRQSVSRDFTTSRGFNFAWKVTEGGFLNLTINYSVNVNSSLAYLETTGPNNSIQRSEREIWREILNGDFFGRDYQLQQNIDFRTAPRLPSLWDINKFFTINAGYSANYQWNNDFRQPELGRSAGFASKTSFGLTLRLKSLMDPLFKESAEANRNEQNNNSRNTSRGRNRDVRVRTEEVKDTSTTSVVSDEMTDQSDTTSTAVKKNPIKNAYLFLRSAVKYVLFDYETISFNFTSDNNLSKSGIYGMGSGFKNFWGLSFDENNGPSRGFIFGLSDNVGRRAPNGSLSDNFTQRNSIDFKTSRPLWEGAKIDLNWKVGWSINKSTSISSDENGIPRINNIRSTGTLDRSFLTMPPILFFSFLDNGITKVNELYNREAVNAQQNLSDAFIEGFETLPLLSKLGFLKEFARYIPRPNWRLSWDGLESFFLFSGVAKKVSLSHEYRSSYTEGWEIGPSGVKQTKTQRIEYGFSPLIGLNLTFAELWEGNLIGSFKYGVRTNYNLGVSTRNITETFSKDIGITAGYSKSGFEIPFFGLSLQNDIEFSLSYTNTTNSTVIFDMNDFKEDGTPQDGTIRTTIEPRIKYTISSKVTVSIFYRRSSVEPSGAAIMPPTTTNEAGLDVHISIQ